MDANIARGGDPGAALDACLRERRRTVNAGTGIRAGRTPQAAAPCPSDSTWPLSAAPASRTGSAATPSGPDWNCPWPLNWQRPYRALAALLDADGHLPCIAPGVTFDGDDLGAWIARQQEPRVWAALSGDQRKRLTALGLRPARTAPEDSGTVRGGRRKTKAEAAVHRGVTALAQWVEREGADKPVPRKHVERVVFDGAEADVRLGVWTSNTRARFGTLSQDERGQLAALGVPWAG